MALGVNLNQGMNNNFRPQGGYGTNPMGNPNMMGGPQMAGQGGNIVSNNLMNNFANNRPMWGNGAPGLPQQMPQVMPPMQGTAIQGPQVSGLTGPINGGTNPLQSGALSSNQFVNSLQAAMNAKQQQLLGGQFGNPGLTSMIGQLPSMMGQLANLGGQAGPGNPGLGGYLGGPGVQMPGGAQMAPQGYGMAGGQGNFLALPNQGIGAGGGGMQAINRPQSMMSPGATFGGGQGVVAPNISGMGGRYPI